MGSYLLRLAGAAVPSALEAEKMAHLWGLVNMRQTALLNAMTINLKTDKISPLYFNQQVKPPYRLAIYNPVAGRGYITFTAVFIT